MIAREGRHGSPRTVLVATHEASPDNPTKGVRARARSRPGADAPGRNPGPRVETPMSESESAPALPAAPPRPAVPAAAVRARETSAARTIAVVGSGRAGGRTLRVGRAPVERTPRVALGRAARGSSEKKRRRAKAQLAGAGGRAPNRKPRLASSRRAARRGIAESRVQLEEIVPRPLAQRRRRLLSEASRCGDREATGCSSRGATCAALWRRLLQAADQRLTKARSYRRDARAALAQDMAGSRP